MSSGLLAAPHMMQYRSAVSPVSSSSSPVQDISLRLENGASPTKRPLLDRELVPRANDRMRNLSFTDPEDTLPVTTASYNSRSHAHVVDVKPRAPSPVLIQPTREQPACEHDERSSQPSREFVLSRLKDKLKSSGFKQPSMRVQASQDENMEMDASEGLPPHTYQLPRVLDADYLSGRDAMSDADDADVSESSFYKKFGSATFPRSYKEEGQSGPFPHLDLPNLSISTEAKLESAEFSKKGTLILKYKIRPKNV